MSLHQTIQVFEALDSAYASGQTIQALFRLFPEVEIEVTPLVGAKGDTDFVRMTIPGRAGKRAGGHAPTLGIVGRLGGLGARPACIGLVSDADGAIAAVATALKLATMRERGDALAGDVIITTHVCPDAPTQPREPVDFMDSPVEFEKIEAEEVLPEMDAVLSVDTTKGNRILNHKGFAISPTVKQGYILRVSEDLLRIMEMTTGRLPVTFPVTTQDITPYGNGVHHLNSIMQPSISTSAPVVGVAISTEATVPGCGTGASHEIDIASAVAFMTEVAKAFTSGKCRLHDMEEYDRLVELYGSLAHLQQRRALG
ncbi:MULTISPECIES: DUF1177 domain-containing protein [unclassified Burkholderia]|uniref:DUF1177 domain-containing protein n=1 Tax=unclassified Burkholderia TaxID=2613784 RepID=UPI002AB313FC|nr:MULTISPECIES: DUF1177 domain-containing protein [unclassified Burkholderia]